MVPKHLDMREGISCFQWTNFSDISNLGEKLRNFLGEIFNNSLVKETLITKPDGESH